MDLVDFFRGRYSWRKLLVLLQRIPRASAYAEAMSQDEEYAEAVLTQVDDADDAPSSPPLSQWTPEVALLAAVYDRLGELTNATIAAAGGKPSPVKPSPRPVTAFDRVSKTLRYQKHLTLVQAFPVTPGPPGSDRGEESA